MIDPTGLFELARWWCWMPWPFRVPEDPVPGP